MEKALIIQKTLGIAAVAVAIAALAPGQMWIAFSVLGQGHFLGAYYYQWNAGKIRTRGVLLFAALAATAIALAIMTGDYLLFAFVASTLFLAHHFHDEITLFGKERSLARTLEILPPLLVFVVFASDRIWGTVLIGVAFVFAGIIYALYGTGIFLRRIRPDGLSVYFLVIFCGLAILYAVYPTIAPEYLTGSVIIFHYICWYVHFYFKCAEAPERRRMYVMDMLAIHGIVFILFAIFLYSSLGSRALAFVFAPIFFYIWATLHIIFSIRLRDYSALLRWR